MREQKQSDWDSTVPEVEVEVDPDSSPNNQGKTSQQLEKTINQLKVWFGQLPVPAKLVVGIIAITGIFSLLQSVLQVVVSLVSIGILAALGYVLYRFVSNSRP